jgi:hypothetical protein
MNTSDFENIVINIFKNIKPEIAFDVFLESLTKISHNSVSWKKKEINEKIIYLFFHEWNAKNHLPESNTIDQHFIVKYFNNLIIDSNYNIIMYNGPKIYDSVRDNIKLDSVLEFIGNELDKCVVYEANEGTSINVFYYEDEWYFTTKRTFNMNESIYGSNNSHGLMFESIIDRDEFIKLLDKSHTYHLTLIHSSNTHLSTIANTDNKIILNNVRNVQDNFKLVDITLLNDKIIKPILSDINSLDGQNLDKQGIIIHYKDYIFRIYNKTYADTLKQKPYYGTIQEKYIHQFQKNEFLTETNDKLYTLTIFNFVAIILHRVLSHFTNFNTDDPKLKFKHINIEDYPIIKSHNVIIRNLNKLQRIPFIIKEKTNVDFNQVKFHLKNHCNYKDIYQMFKIFNEKDNLIIKCIKYNPPKNNQHKDHINLNIEAFANLKF